MTKRLLIICDVRVFRDGLERSLRRLDSLEVVGTAGSASEALDRLRGSGAELVLLDMAMPDGVDMIAAMTREMPDVRVVALGVDEQPRAVLALVEAGAAGYVPREASLRGLIESVEAVARGEVLCSPRVAGSLVRRVASLTSQHPAAIPLCGLTEREREILALIEQGSTNKQIARRLRVKLPTVKNHVHNILEKLGVSNRGEAAAVSRNGKRRTATASRRTHPDTSASKDLDHSDRSMVRADV